ncbi:phospholipase D family protein [Salinivibrio kushneri]|uniref:Phospholipase D family protein n=2 Tax=Salinivibrio kushneri TaxID=1908198 RepID=A0AB36K297_9GAMM|nr:phospholipase D family protein [Salinivibrio kushneri]
MITVEERMKQLTILIGLLLLLTGCQSIANSDNKLPSHFLGFYSESSLRDYVARPTNIPPDYAGFLPLKTGRDALLARLAMIESASQSLDVQYYIFRSDETSQLIIWRLYEAAERGVRVRVLLDDMQSRDDSSLAYLDAHPNIEVRLFNPHQYRISRVLSWLTDGKRLNRRMHNKSLSADGVFSIVGGRNIGNEYFSYQSSVEFSDFDLMLYGDVVSQTQKQFDDYWNSDYAHPMSDILRSDRSPSREDIEQWRKEANIEHQFTRENYNFHSLALYESLKNHQLPMRWGPIRLMYDKPEKITLNESDMTTGIVELLQGVESDMVLVSPYFVPTDTGTQALINAVKKGKDITILTNSLASNDVFAVHGWYAKYRHALVKGGVHLWEMKSQPFIKQKSQWSVAGSSRASLHAKLMLLDHQKLFVGSMNLDPRSADLNTEMGVVVTHPDYVRQALRELRTGLMVSAYELRLEDEDLIWIDHQTGERFQSDPDVGKMRSMGAWLSGWLPIEGWL